MLYKCRIFIYKLLKIFSENYVLFVKIITNLSFVELRPTICLRKPQDVLYKLSSHDETMIFGLSWLKYGFSETTLVLDGSSVIVFKNSYKIHFKSDSVISWFVGIPRHWSKTSICKCFSKTYQKYAIVFDF